MVTPSSLTTARSSGAGGGGGVSVSVSVQVLLAGTQSGPLRPSSTIETVLVVCAGPAGAELLTVTTSVRVRVAPTASVPSSQVTTPWAKLPPPEALTNATPAGSVSVTTTPTASTLPRF